MASIRNLQFVLSGKDAGASKALDGVGRKADGLSSKLAGVGKAAGAGLAGIAVGAAAFGKSAIEAFQEAQESQERLQFALDKFPKLADTSAKKLDKLNGALAAKTRYDDDAIATGQAVLAQFDLTGKQLEDVTPLLLDYAAATGKDVSDAAGSLGKALGGSTKALKEVGINYKSTGDKAKDFTNIQKLLNDKVGGFAANEGKTAAGQADILRNKFGEFKETVGAQLLPVVTQFVDYLSVKVVPALQKFADEFTAGTGPGGEFRDTLASLRDVMADLWPHIKTAFEWTSQIVGFVADHPDAFKAIAIGVAAYATAMKAAAFWTAAMAAIDFLKLAGGLDKTGAAADRNAGKLSKFSKAAGLLGVALAAGTILGAIDQKYQESLGEGKIKGDDGVDYIYDPKTGKFAPQKPSAPLPRSNGDDYRRPRGGLVVGTVDNKRLSSATANAQQGRVARGFLAPGY